MPSDGVCPDESDVMVEHVAAILNTKHIDVAEWQSKSYANHYNV